MARLFAVKFFLQLFFCFLWLGKWMCLQPTFSLLQLILYEFAFLHDDGHLVSSDGFDIIQRIAVEDKQIGALAGFERAGDVSTQRLCAIEGSGDDTYPFLLSRLC